MFRALTLSAIAAVSMTLLGCGQGDNANDGAESAEDVTLNVYSARKEDLIRPILDRFTADTGIEVKLLTAKAGALLARLENEGENTPADLLVTVDAGNLHRAKAAGVLAPLESEVLDANIPEHLRDPEGHWYGLSKRARVIFTHKERMAEGEITTYEQLADAEFDDRICIRSSDNIYNQSLVASMIIAHDEPATEDWAEGLVDNMARKPQGGDRDQLRAVAAGECDIAVANTYYYGRMQNGSEADRKVADSVRLVWPNQDGRGAHINVSGAGLVAASDKQDAVRKLLEYLTTDESQDWYAQVNNEHPVKPGVEPSPTLAAWGEFKADDVNLGRLGELNDEAVRLMDRAGWK